MGAGVGKTGEPRVLRQHPDDSGRGTRDDPCGYPWNNPYARNQARSNRESEEPVEADL